HPPHDVWSYGASQKIEQKRHGRHRQERQTAHKNPAAGSLVTIRAGIPTTVELDGMSRMTTAFAPIFTLSPIVTGPRIFAPAPTKTLFPNLGTSGKLARPPMVTFCAITQFSPMIVFGCNTTPSA